MKRRRWHYCWLSSAARLEKERGEGSSCCPLLMLPVGDAACRCLLLLLVASHRAVLEKVETKRMRKGKTEGEMEREEKGRGEERKKRWGGEAPEDCWVLLLLMPVVFPVLLFSPAKWRGREGENCATGGRQRGKGRGEKKKRETRRGKGKGRRKGQEKKEGGAGERRGTLLVRERERERGATGEGRRREGEREVQWLVRKEEEEEF
nr:cilia- and flagella-associated protein 251-like [Solanum lycopersicum]